MEPYETMEIRAIYNYNLWNPSKLPHLQTLVWQGEQHSRIEMCQHARIAVTSPKVSFLDRNLPHC